MQVEPAQHLLGNRATMRRDRGRLLAGGDRDQLNFADWLLADQAARS